MIRKISQRLKLANRRLKGPLLAMNVGVSGYIRCQSRLVFHSPVGFQHGLLSFELSVVSRIPYHGMFAPWTAAREGELARAMRVLTKLLDGIWAAPTLESLKDCGGSVSCGLEDRKNVCALAVHELAMPATIAHRLIGPRRGPGTACPLPAQTRPGASQSS